MKASSVGLVEPQPLAELDLGFFVFGFSLVESLLRFMQNDNGMVLKFFVPMSLTLLRASTAGLTRSLLRGPKKVVSAAAKKGKSKTSAGEAADHGGDSESSHIFNIFAGVPDCVLEDDEKYPKWLWSLADPPKSYSELASTFIYGVGIEHATENDYRRFLRQHRKLVIKTNNARLRKSKAPPENKIRFP